MQQQSSREQSGDLEKPGEIAHRESGMPNPPYEPVRPQPNQPTAQPRQEVDIPRTSLFPQLDF